MAQAIHLTNEQARRFLLHKQGLIGEHIFEGKNGALDYIHSVGSIQFDPVDVCGKNAELILQSRVAGFTKRMLSDLLYRDRALVDYFDKNLCIMPVEDWPYFGRGRIRYGEHERGRKEIDAVRGEIRKALEERGALSSADLDYGEKVSWFWSDTRLSRAALEHMYFCGELAVHHKKGSIKYYDFAERCIPEDILRAPEPYPDEAAHQAWRVERRIGAIGLLWNRASDAWLGIDSLKAAQRDRAFEMLLSDQRIAEVRVDGVREPLYCRARDMEALAYVQTNPVLRGRCEFLAPLDCLLWDRKMIVALFGFDYKWEIYTPESQRKYGHYVLPVLHGDRFVGRIELVRNKNTGIEIKNIWYEDGVRPTKALIRKIESRAAQFARFDRSAAEEDVR
jgi:uncharacterized protein YcaQ